MENIPEAMMEKYKDVDKWFRAFFSDDGQKREYLPHYRACWDAAMADRDRLQKAVDLMRDALKWYDKMHKTMPYKTNIALNALDKVDALLDKGVR